VKIGVAPRAGCPIVADTEPAAIIPGCNWKREVIVNYGQMGSNNILKIQLKEFRGFTFNKSAKDKDKKC